MFHFVDSIWHMTGVDWVFFFAALLGGCLFIVRLILMIFGFHSGDGDMGGGDLSHVDTGGHAGGSDTSFKLLSLQDITGFFMMFGLVGLALRKESHVSTGWAILGGLTAGLLAVWLISLLFAGMRKLQSSGTLDMRNAVGQTGSIYLTIPATGTGQAQLVVQGRLLVADAISAAKVEIKTGEHVKVMDVVNGNVLVVEKV